MKTSGRSRVFWLLIPGMFSVCVIIGTLVASTPPDFDRPAPNIRQGEPFVPRRLSAFSRDKARRLIRDRLPCLGCHELDGDGGRIGPSLSDVASRLSSDAIYRMIRDPDAEVPGTIMPAHPMTEERVILIASFLSSRGSGGADRRAAMSTTLSSDGGDGAGLYARFCAVCHGTEGRGDGLNAEYLPVRPTAHAERDYMSTRPDDTLFDGIHAGGFILGKSHRMPAFGHKLSSEQIRSLVRYIRTLCECEGPAWSRDGGSE